MHDWCKTKLLLFWGLPVLGKAQRALEQAALALWHRLLAAPGGCCGTRCSRGVQGTEPCFITNVNTTAARARWQVLIRVSFCLLFSHSLLFLFFI